jgi:VWFA-related protein
LKKEEPTMKTRWIAGPLVLLIILLSILPSNAQGVVNVSIDDLDLDQHPRTEAWVTVRNENGVPIPGLGVQNFELVEDGVASFPPSAVRTQVNPEAGISIVMVIDVSGSMEGKPIQEAINAANALIDQLAPSDRAAIIAFADDVDIDPTNLEEGKELAFTTDKNALRNVVNFLDQKIGWDTPLYDAIYKGVKMVYAEPVGRRAVVVMTDGRDERDNAQGVAVKDEGSQVSPDDPINEANRRNIPIFSIGLVGLGGTDTKYLNRLAERTGAVYQQAPEPEELTPLFENVVHQLQEQYVLTYESRVEEDDNPHSLLVRVQVPEGQGNDEVKYRFSDNPLVTIPAPSQTDAAPATAPPDTGATEPPPVAAATQAPVAPTPAPTPLPVVTEEPGLIDGITDAFTANPLLGIVIGAGVLLLIILIVALLIVLFRGRGGEDDAYDSSTFEEPTYGPTPGEWPADSGGPSTPLMDRQTEGPMEGAPTDWPAPGPDTPLADQPPVGQPVEPMIPASGGTRLIQRQPKYVAMLVDKARPSVKYDLQAMTNIGRARDNQIVLDDPTVSRNHAWIKIEDKDFVIFDIGSANGTFVNDEPVENPRSLEHGDIVRFGDATFIFTRVA